MKHLTPPIKDYGRVENNIDIDLSLTNAHCNSMTLIGNVLLNFINPPPPGTQLLFEIEVFQDEKGRHYIVFPASLNSSPTINQEPHSCTILTFFTNDGGISYRMYAAK